MELIRDTINNKIIFVDNNIEIMQLGFTADEFCWVINTNEIINITHDLDSDFYNGLKKIMNSDYRFEFPKALTYKENNKLSWYSDSAGNIEDENVTNNCSRLNINLDGEIFKIWAEKPIYVKYNLSKKYHCIVFSPGGNGQGAKNVEFGSNFQDEIVLNLFLNILHPKYCLEKVKIK